MAEIAELRKERQDLLRALADARDRGDRIVNTLLEARGAEPIPPSPGPPPVDDDIFEEDQARVETIRALMREVGEQTVLMGRETHGDD
jgi:hypothetical protein